MIPPGDSTEWTDEIMAEDTSGRKCSHDDFGIRPLTGTIGMSEDRECLLGTLSRCMGEGCGPSPVLPGTVSR